MPFKTNLPKDLIFLLNMPERHVLTKYTQKAYFLKQDLTEGQNVLTEYTLET